MLLKSQSLLFSLLFSLLIHSSAFAQISESIPKNRLEQIAQSRLWLRLLHYKSTPPFYQHKSQVDGPEFFLSQSGATDPYAELIATLDSFEQNKEIGQLKQHPQCAFPARYHFLKKELNLNTIDVPCVKLNEFLSKFNAQSVTISYSSAYPNNPASMFGHTFLRINSKSDRNSNQEKLDILDYGLNYAASVRPDENGVIFALFGLFGGYQGHFSSEQYYKKVNEYNNGESRDIWEYDLNLNEAETRTLLMHAWEIETNSYFRYYFFDENCSYQILTLLEVARPDWDLSTFHLYAVPSETVQRLAQTPGAVTNVKFRPSLRKKMFQKFNSLTASEKDSFLKLLDKKLTLNEINQTATLEAFYSYIYYEKKKNDGKLSPERQNQLQEALIRRSKLNDDPNNDNRKLSQISEHTRPDEGHPPFQFGVSSGLQPKSLFEEISFKFAYHDLLNRDVGYDRFSHIDFPSFSLRYYNQYKKLHIEKLGILSITSLVPITFVEKPLSWRLNFEIKTPYDYRCNFCHLFSFESGAGFTIPFYEETQIFYALGLGRIELGKSLHRFWRFTPLLQVAYLGSFFDRYKTHLGASWVHDVFQHWRQKSYYEIFWNHSLAWGRRWENRILLKTFIPTSTAGQAHNEAQLTLNYYY